MKCSVNIKSILSSVSFKGAISLLIHWVILLCALSRDQTGNLGVSGQCCNQLSYLARIEPVISWHVPNCDYL